MARRILVVEDDPSQRNMICMLLSNAGYGVVECDTVRLALMHLDIIDLSGIVLDLYLPNGHGKAVVDALIAKRDDVPVVILSGRPEEAPHDFPVIKVLDKPYKREDLLVSVLACADLSDALKEIRVTTRRMKEKSSSINARVKLDSQVGPQDQKGA